MSTIFERNAKIIVSTLPEPSFPAWSKGRHVFTGDIRKPRVIDFAAIMSDPWLHPGQTGADKDYPTGYDVLRLLMRTRRTIDGHYGLKEIEHIVKNWDTLPTPEFQEWAKGKSLYGYRDTCRDGHGHAHAPCLSIDDKSGRPKVSWETMTASLWYENDLGLCKK